MKTKILIVIVILLIAAAAAFFFWPKKESGPILPGGISPSQSIQSAESAEI